MVYREPGKLVKKLMLMSRDDETKGLDSKCGLTQERSGISSVNATQELRNNAHLLRAWAN